MFEYLQQINSEIYSRYLTVEKNIKAASNSFYDSYLALQEHLVKFVAEANAIHFGLHESCGALLNKSKVKDLFVNKYGLDARVYGKMGDYTKKTNEHKHQKEKNVEVETVVNYMRIFYEVSSRVALANGLKVPQFSGKYFRDMFGEMSKLDEKIDRKLDEKFDTLRDDIIKAVAEKHREDINVAAQTQQQNKVNSEQYPQSNVSNVKSNGQLVLKNFIANAEKKYCWMGTKRDFDKAQITLMCIQVALILVGVISSIVSSISLKIYSTFTFFENIVVFETFFLLIYAIKAKKFYPDYKLAKHTADIFVLDKDGIWRDSGKEKKRYRTFRFISYFAVVLNVIFVWITEGNIAIKITATILEAAFFGLTIASSITRINLYCMYKTVFISGYNASGTEKITIVHDGIMNKIYTYEEYQEQFPFLI